MARVTTHKSSGLMSINLWAIDILPLHYFGWKKWALNQCRNYMERARFSVNKHMQAQNVHVSMYFLHLVLFSLQSCDSYYAEVTTTLCVLSRLTTHDSSGLMSLSNRHFTITLFYSRWKVSLKLVEKLLHVCFSVNMYMKTQNKHVSLYFFPHSSPPSRPSQLDVTTTLGVLSQILDRDHFAVITRTELCSKLSC